MTPDLPVPAPCGGTASVNPTGGTPPYSFLWSDGDTSANRSGLCAGTYTVTVSDATGCARIDTAVVDGLVNVDELHAGFNFSPNPVEDVLHLTSPKSLGDIKLFTAVGRLVMQQRVSTNGTSLDLSELSSGIYFLSVNNNHFKLLKQ